MLTILRELKMLTLLFKSQFNNKAIEVDHLLNFLVNNSDFCVCYS